ncbi:MAG: endonuclease III [Christensenellales bacterium]|jgi:endonuclease-3
MDINKDKILEIIEAEYPGAKSELDFRTPFELLVATILSAQCTDVRVNIVTAELFKEHNTPKAMLALGVQKLEEYIKTCGLFRSKAKNIIAASRIIIEKYGGEVPSSLEELRELPGVGRKTANVVAFNAFGIPAIAVDTHVFRVSNRLGLTDAKNVLNTEKMLMEVIPRERWGDAHHWILLHGRRVCKARNPECGICRLSEYCRYYAGNKQ